VGPGYWYVTGTVDLELEGVDTVTTGVTLDVDPEVVHGGQRTVEVAATAAHADGVEEIADVALVLYDGHGRIVETWSSDDFDEVDGHVLELDTAYRLRGPSPWSFQLTMEDTDGQRYEVERTVRHERGQPD
jgi:hypothetical protein